MFGCFMHNKDINAQMECRGLYDIICHRFPFLNRSRVIPFGFPRQLHQAKSWGIVLFQYIKHELQRVYFDCKNPLIVFSSLINSRHF